MKYNDMTERDEYFYLKRTEKDVLSRKWAMYTHYMEHRDDQVGPKCSPGPKVFKEKM